MVGFLSDVRRLYRSLICSQLSDTNTFSLESRSDLAQGIIAPVPIGTPTYTRRYDEIISPVPRKGKCVEDTLLYVYSIEQSFYHTWDYLIICANNGIVINASKFQFCKDTVTLTGLNITPKGKTPSNNLLLAIKDFPIPKDITGANSWFGPVNQLSWAYSISNIMQPFRELIKHNNKFYWDDVLTRLFHDSKAVLIDAVKEGIRSFDINRPTCLQCDWCKDRLGYLLLQKYCTGQCPNMLPRWMASGLCQLPSYQSS